MEKKRIMPYLILIIILFSSFQPQELISGIDREVAIEMFTYLQALRQKKTDRSDKLNRYVKKKRPLLTWNDTLAKVAEARAIDLAEKNYFDHIDPLGYGVNYYIDRSGYYLEPDWTEKRSDNFFESLQAGRSDAYDIIEDLLIDKGIPSKGHRKHLLGLDDWNEKNSDIGIGFYRVGDGIRSEYATYTVIIIARHRW